LRGELFLCYKYKGGTPRRRRSRLAVGSRPNPSAKPSTKKSSSQQKIKINAYEQKIHFRKVENKMDREEKKQKKTKELIDREELKSQIDELMRQYDNEEIDGATYAQKMMELTTSYQDKN
jgi:hypothetical protein